jgi:T5SS/PEP-CTERM-associated repeat protein
MKKKFIIQLALKFTKKNAILLGIAALTLLASPGVALADCTPVTNWTDGKSSWFTCSNWSNDQCPSSTIGAVVDNGGTAQISVSTPQASACSLSLGPTSGNSGNVSVSTGGNLTVTYGITIGDQGTGSLTVTNSGSSVTSGDGIAVGGSTATGVGTLTVSNSGTVSATSVTVNTSGTLTGNGTVSANSGSGTVTIDGTLAPHPGTLTITGNLSFGPNANMSCTVSSTTVDNVQVSGRATLNGKLSVTVNSAGDFTLLHAGGGIGTAQFSSYSFTYNGCFSVTSVEYDTTNGNVILHVVTTC